jgi:hemerythrin superfamily protein
MNAITMLQADHQQIKTLFSRLNKTRRADIRGREEGLKELKTLLEIHLSIEERVFFPACHRSPHVGFAADTVRQLHPFMVRLLRDLVRYEVDTDEWTLTFILLQETFDDHVRALENELFPKVRERFLLAELESMSDEMLVHRLTAERSFREGWELIMHPEG